MLLCNCQKLLDYFFQVLYVLKIWRFHSKVHFILLLMSINVLFYCFHCLKSVPHTSSLSAAVSVAAICCSVLLKNDSFSVSCSRRLSQSFSFIVCLLLSIAHAVSLFVLLARSYSVFSFCRLPSTGNNSLSSPPPPPILQGTSDPQCVVWNYGNP